MIPKKKIIRTLEQVFESFGFSPIDTPALEYTEILLGKGSGETDKQIYRFEDHGGRDVALRFDLTVPLARFVSQHFSELVFPFKRYHIAPVWRGERPQYGRYRQFYQCDIDILGDGELSLEHDAEIISLVVKIFRNLQIPHFHTQINNRKILTGFFESLNKLSDPIFSNVPKCMEKYGTGYGFIAYQTKLNRDYNDVELLFESLGDRAQVYINRDLAGICYINENLELKISAKAGDELTIITENTGRAYFGAKMMRKKGIAG
jgi:histidyl-tRNA synthetase